MVAARISPFGGMVPAVDDRLLPDINGALAQNTWLYGGTAVGMAAPKLLKTLQASTAKVYRIPNNYTDSLHLNDSVWMEFTHPDTDVLRTQVIGDVYDRYYWMSPVTAPRYAPIATIKAQVPNVTGYLLGVPAPGTISASASGGSSTTLKTVSYVQTFVSAYGEEGPPSAPFILSGIKIDASVTVTLHAPDPGDLGTNRNLTRSRIYRTVVASNGTATFFFVADLPISTTTYTDSASDATVALNAILASTNWQGPPSDLQGMVSLSNGMVVGFRQNELWFCEPYRMHAWPAQYSLVTEYPIVGLGVSNQMLVVATEGFAYTATGINPSSMNLVKLPGLVPCTARGSILSTTRGVYFAAPSGLVIISTAGIQVATKELIQKDKWAALVSTNTLRAAELNAGYFAFGQSRPGVFDIATFDNASFAQQDFSGARNGILIDPTSLSVAFNLMQSTLPVVNVQSDAWSNEVFVLYTGQLYWLDIGDATQTRQTYKWRSKIQQLAYKQNMQAMKVYFNGSPTWPITYVQVPQIPVMTGPTTGAVTMSGYNPGAPNEPWRAASAGGYWTGNTSIAANVITDLGVATVISSYAVGCPPSPAPPTTAPMNWVLWGSNDGVAYTLVDAQSGAPAFSSGEVRTYNVASGSQAAYRYYMIVIGAAQSGTIVSMGSYQLNKPELGVIRVYADGNLIMTRELVTSGEQWRMPSGFKADYWQFEIEAGVEVYSLQAATSPAELRGV